MSFFWAHFILSSFAEYSSSVNLSDPDPVDETNTQEDELEAQIQASPLKFLCEVVNGDWVQSALTHPPWVAQPSAL